MPSSLLRQRVWTEKRVLVVWTAVGKAAPSSEPHGHGAAAVAGPVAGQSCRHGNANFADRVVNIGVLFRIVWRKINGTGLDGVYSI